MREMFHLASLHDIKPLIEKFPMDKANEAIDRLMAGDVRYRSDYSIALHLSVPHACCL